MIEEKQLRHHHRLLAAFLLITLGFWPASAFGEDFVIGLSAGLGGVLGEDFDNSSIEALFAYQIAHKTFFTVRAGELDLEDTDSLPIGGGGAPRLESLRYVSLAGEYRRPASFYTSGVFFGLGLYQLEVFDGVFQSDEEESLGLNLGVTGDIRLYDRFSVLIQFSGHYADLDTEQFFLMASAGLAYKF